MACIRLFDCAGVTLEQVRIGLTGICPPFMPESVLASNCSKVVLLKVKISLRESTSLNISNSMPIVLLCYLALAHRADSVLTIYHYQMLSQGEKDYTLRATETPIQSTSNEISWKLCDEGAIIINISSDSSFFFFFSKQQIIEIHTLQDQLTINISVIKHNYFSLSDEGRKSAPQLTLWRWPGNCSETIKLDPRILETTSGHFTWRIDIRDTDMIGFTINGRLNV